ncbi:MAG: hypothetical protein IAE97_00205 [Chthoniobacterales bacterium]|nr:hypothetical protein [Chthoniobacterales bacterium]
MSKDDIHQVAQRDTPPEIVVPNTWPALAVWATGKFGVGFLMAIAFGFAANQVYGDMKARDDKVLAAFENSARSQAETAGAIREMTKAIETIARR